MTGMGEWETAKRETEPIPGADESAVYYLRLRVVIYHGLFSVQ